MAYEIWTDEAVAEALAQPGAKVESAKDRAKWMDFYRELDALRGACCEDHAAQDHEDRFS